MAKAARAQAKKAGSKAVSPKAPPLKILRIGVVQGNRIVEEKLIRLRRNVTLGQHARNTFAIPSAYLPRTYEVLRVTEETYTLRFTEGMDGRVTLGGKVRTFHQIKQMGAAKKVGDFWHLRLETNARGKVVIGDITLLFQFVAAPPVRPKARLPSFIRGGVFGRLDWSYASIVSGTFAIHLALAIVFLVIDKPKEIGGGRFASMAKVEVKRKVQKMKQREATTGEGEDGAGDMSAGMEAMEAMKARSRGRSRSRARASDSDEPRGDPNKPRKLDTEVEDDLVNGLTQAAINSDAGKQAFKAVALAHKGDGEGGPTISGSGDPLASGMASTSLDKSASNFGASGSGGGPGGPGSSSRGSGGRRMRGTGRVGRGIRGPSRDVESRKPRVRKPMGPRPRLSSRVPSIGGAVNKSLASKIKRRLRAKVYGLKRLYNQQLQSNKFRCSVKISFVLQKSGRLSSVNVSGGCPGSFLSAVKRRVRSWRLPKGASGFQKLSVSFSY
jgi:hypothetical protein